MPSPKSTDRLASSQDPGPEPSLCNGATGAIPRAAAPPDEMHSTADERAQNAEALVLDTVGRMPAHPSDQQSVEQIEGAAWPEPAPDATYLIRRVHQLRRVPVGELSIEDVRIMLSQSAGTVAILPRVLDMLEENPLSAGDFYPGDLWVDEAA
ncbi:contact-dependent growth inhibition system immunity protein [Nocardia sp. A7]|uniref:contact-dependent growth inhibition system immunity protein n=1 Tax=Nocardia sp. A7 TaxID=2789274 RepID=UPI00397841CA